MASLKDLITKGVDLQHCSTIEAKREEILDYFLKTWDIDEKIYTVLKSDEVFFERGDPLRHVIMFYYGHTASFYINKMMISKIITKRINPEYESIFAIGVDEMSWDDLNNNHYNWPSAENVRDYRKKVKEVVIKVIKETPLTVPITWESPFWIVLMSIEHSRIHLETSSVLIRQLPINSVVPNRFGPVCDQIERSLAKIPKNELIFVSGGKVSLGKPYDHPIYGWDNEYGHDEVVTKDFKASKYLVSNGEFLEFVNDKGYSSQEYWTEEGWEWRTYKKAEHPLFWIKKGESDYKLRLIDAEVDMPWNWPVELNYLEAKAFCNWKSKKLGKIIRMPTEAEYFRLYDSAKLPDILEWNTAPGNINLEHYASPCPVDLFKNGDSFYDVIGNVWQWSESTINGFHGFKVHPTYDDFTAPTIDGKHNLIKGGSFISTGNEASHHARYAFRRHFYQHAGFRYIESECKEVDQTVCEYENDPEVCESCEFNWGDKNDKSILNPRPNFAVQFNAKILEILKQNNVDIAQIRKVLDLNSDTGRLPFELAKTFNDITALDLSARFIKVSISLQENGSSRYLLKDEGDLNSYREICLEDYEINRETLGKKIMFMQADANNIKSLYTGYDLIIIPNLLEEIAYPDRLLSSIHERFSQDDNRKRILIVASTYQWDLKKTPKEHWIGGFKRDGEGISSFDGMKDILSEHFTLIGEPSNLEFVLKKSSRLSELRNSHITAWQLK